MHCPNDVGDPLDPDEVRVLCAHTRGLPVLNAALYEQRVFGGHLARDPVDDVALLQRQNTNVMTSVSIRADLARAVGGWDGGQERAGDWDLWKRALAGGARPAMTLEPTVLHFRASGRVQAWPLRVRQNTEWLERISDPAVLPDVRRRLRRLQGERDARQLSYVLELESYRDDLHAEREALHAEIAEQRRRVAEIHAGGWWRLRTRLLPLMRLFGRGDT